MRFPRRRLSLHPDAPPPGEAPAASDGGDGGGGSGGDAKPPKSTPDTVPYSVFQKTNADLKTATGKLQAAEAKLGGFDGWIKPDDHTKAVQEAADQATLLADGRVAPSYRGYIAERMKAAKPTDNAKWLSNLRGSEPAFFDVVLDGTPAPKPKTPPKTTPEGGADPKPPGTGRQLSARDIDAMSVDEYTAWKAGGGLKRLTDGAPH